MSSPTGVILRLVGPLIQVLCFALLQKWGGQERTVLGVAVEHWLYAGFGVGLVMVILGLTVFRSRRAESLPDAGDRR